MLFHRLHMHIQSISLTQAAQKIKRIFISPLHGQVALEYKQLTMLRAVHHIIRINVSAHTNLRANIKIHMKNDYEEVK